MKKIFILIFLFYSFAKSMEEEKPNATGRLPLASNTLSFLKTCYKQINRKKGKWNSFGFLIF